MRQLRMRPLLLLLVLAPVGCGTDAGYDTEAMLVSLVDEVIIPDYATFASSTATLDDWAATFCTDRTDTNLVAVQGAWSAARRPWKQGEAHAIGPVYDYPWRIGPLVDSPVRTDNVDAVLAGSDVLDEAFLDSVGATHQGMHAIEYLLFDPMGDLGTALAAFTDPTTGDRRCAYLLALTAALHTHATEIVDAWDPAGDDYRAAVVNAAEVGTPYASAHEAATVLLNQLVATVEGVYEVRLGDPAGSVTGVPDPSLVESPFAHHSLLDAQDALQGARRLYEGTLASPESLGFATWVRAEDPGVADRADDAFADATAALAAITGPLSEAVVSQASEVAAAIEAITALSDTLTTDVADAVGISIDPSLDGD